MKRFCALLLAGLALSALAACHPTPEESVVVSKQADISEQAEESTGENPLTEIPAVLQEENVTLSDRLSVQIDAEIKLPESGKLPLARLSRQDIRQETGDQWLQALADGRKVYYARNLDEYSRDELEGFLQYLDEEQNWPPRLMAMEDFLADTISQGMDALKKHLDTAPAQPQHRFYETGDPVLDRAFEFDSDHQVCLAWIANGFTALRYRCYNIRFNDGLVTSLESGDAQGGVTLSLEDALSQAAGLLKDMGLEDFTLNGAGWIPYDDKYTEAVESYEAYPKCYALYFTKEIGGMNETYVDPTYVRISNREERYQPVWEPEYVAVQVADEGILAVEIPIYPSKAELLEENVRILPFAEVMDQFYEQLTLSGCWVDQAEEEIIENRTVYIDEIVLGGMRTIEKDAETYLYSPVWSFFGRVVTTYKDGMGDEAQLDENNQFLRRDYRQCVLTLSAIDGRVINRALGY